MGYRVREDGFDGCEAKVFDFFFLVAFHASGPFEWGFHFPNRRDNGGKLDRHVCYIGRNTWKRRGVGRRVLVVGLRLWGCWTRENDDGGWTFVHGQRRGCRWKSMTLLFHFRLYDGVDGDIVLGFEGGLFEALLVHSGGWKGCCCGVKVESL